MMRRTLPAMILLGGTLLLAGCKRHHEPPAQNEAVEAPPPVAPKPKPEVAPIAPPVAAKPKPKPLPPTPAEQQVLDDADATGMTARVDRSGSGDTSAADTNQNP